MSTAPIHWKGRNLMDPDRPYTTGEVAQLFNVDPRTVARWAEKNKLESFRTLGGHRRYQVKEVIELFRKLGLKFPEDNER
jgi:excisionase family DNA binding protein